MRWRQPQASACRPSRCESSARATECSGCCGRQAMSEPDGPRWLDEIAGELRREVPVRPVWRARLLEEVARAPRPSARDDVDDALGDPDARARYADRRRWSITVGPVVSLAAATLLVALGAGATYMVMSRVGGNASQRPAQTAASAASPQLVS